MLMVLMCLMTATAFAHHVLGRPAYSLSDDSNTPPSMQVETQIGDFYVTYMAFPAFPQPGQQGRVNLYATHRDRVNHSMGRLRLLLKMINGLVVIKKHWARKILMMVFIDRDFLSIMQENILLVRSFFPMVRLTRLIFH